MIALTQEQADKTVTTLVDAGFAGAILAVMVAPVLLMVVKGAQKRQEQSDAREDRAATARMEREARLVTALEESVRQQRVALEQWRGFEVEEKQTHAAIISNMAQMTHTLATISNRLGKSSE